jgi:hypothetical protein
MHVSYSQWRRPPAISDTVSVTGVPFCSFRNDTSERQVTDHPGPWSSAGQASVVEMDVDAAVAAAFLLDLADAHLADLGRRSQVSAAAGLQVHALYLE